MTIFCEWIRAWNDGRWETAVYLCCREARPCVAASVYCHLPAPRCDSFTVSTLPSSRQHLSNDDFLEDKRWRLSEVLCCVVHYTSIQWCVHTHKQFLQFNCLFRFAFCIFCHFVLVLLWSPYVIGQTIIFSSCFFLLLSSFFSSPNLSGRRLDVYHTSAHGVVLL